MIILFFSMATLLLAWLLFGYVIWLRWAGAARRQPLPVRLTSWPALSVVIPCKNEEGLIADKYHNLISGTYPRDQLEIVFADGGSTDSTLNILKELAGDDPRIRIVSCPVGGKIAQLNYALPKLSCSLVLVTDADARLAPDALEQIAAEFEADVHVGVVGACTVPRGGLAVERCFWQAQNRVRALESDASHVSMVIACCYAFRRDLITGFPDDVIADDVYVAAVANTRGHRSVYSTRALVEELRTPSNIREFFSHKFRKSNAVFRELLRFVYRLPDMDGSWKSILTTRIVQQMLLPWGTLLWLLSAATLVNLGYWRVLGVGAGMMFAALVATRRATMAVTLPGKQERFSVITLGLAYVYTMVILCATGVTYWSFRQDSRYARLASRPRSMDRNRVERVGGGRPTTEVALEESLSGS